MTARQIKKPEIDMAAALAFATSETPEASTIKTVKVGRSKGGEVVKRAFFAPEGDKRLTINLNQDLHRKLKIAAIEQGTTAGEIIEQLIAKHL